MKRILLTLGIFLISYFSFSQPYVLTMPDTSGCNAQTLSVPVYASGFPNNVGAITLYIGFDNNTLEFESGVSGSVPGMWFNSVGSSIAISWSSLAGVDPNGILCYLNFTFISGSCNLSFFNNCEITTVDLITLSPLTLNDGSVTSYSGTNWFVDDAVASSGNGKSWATAFKTIGEATTLQLFCGDSILVKPGTYNESVDIVSSGSLTLAPTTGVTLSDTNKITLSAGTDLRYTEAWNHPGDYYAHVYRSWKSNSGVYKIISIDTALHELTVEDAAFAPESGIAGDSTHLTVALTRPVMYTNSEADPVSNPVVLTVSGGADVMYIGESIGDGNTDANPANCNLIDAFTLTGISNGHGLHIQSSSYNIFRNSQIIDLDTTGILIRGNQNRPAMYNTIEGCEIKNTGYQGIYIGQGSGNSANEHALFTHLIDNEIYTSISRANGTLKSGIEINRLNPLSVIDGNLIRNFNLLQQGSGALKIHESTLNTLMEV